MSELLHKIAEGLRAREKYLEDHNDHPAFDGESGDQFKKDFEGLKHEIKEMNARIKEAVECGKDVDEHLLKTIKGDHRMLSVRIDTWQRKVGPNTKH